VRWIFCLFSFGFNDDDKNKYSQIYEKCHDGLLKHAYSILHNQQDAEDAVQDAFERVLKHIDKLSESDSKGIPLYLKKAVENRAITLYRNNSKKSCQDLGEQGIDSLIDNKETALSVLLVKELHQMINNYIRNNLDEIDRQIMILSWKGLHYKEIAKITGISDGYVSVKLTRIRAKMKKALGIEVMCNE